MLWLLIALPIFWRDATDHLLSSPANEARLMEAIEQLDS